MPASKRLLLLLLPLTLAFAPVAERDAAEFAAIRQTLQHYIDGHATGQREVMASAFHESARLQFMRDGQYMSTSLEQYLSGFRGNPAADEAQRVRRVVSIDYRGDAAAATVELDYPNVFFTDYMQLLKIDGEWKIVNKIFNVHRK